MYVPAHSLTSLISLSQDAKDIIFEIFLRSAMLNDFVLNI